ncbi:MAG: DUF4302 domain-containing protein [Reichenbachiella sp.]|uniref:DUF4302 domain-containing protein n=1 Tax=Reichenbachiella sp. TaxID=2184521 RepID=UPI00329758BB
MTKNILFYVFLFFLISSCDNGLDKITPPAERSAEAISNLRDDLEEPANGWVLNYQPTPESGIFYLLLKFNDDGTVRIQSDVPGDEDYFYDQTIPYRIDTRLSLELIFETYAVLHYLFEQNASTFGAEFEFYYLEKDGDNLMFASKSDNLGENTVITLEPASADAADVFSRELPENLFAYDTISSLFVGPMQHISLTEENLSIFWSINLDERNISVSSVGEGLSVSEVATINNTKILNHQTGYGFSDGKLVLSDPLNFSFGGENITISEMSLNSYSETGPPMCTDNPIATPVYSGSVSGLGNTIMYKTLFDVKGMDFQPQSESPYSINVFYVADSTGISISQRGSIEELFPTANWFLFNYGFDDDNPSDPLDPQPAYAVGLERSTDAGDRTILREFVPTITVNNTVSVVPTDNYWPNDITAEEISNLEIVVDEIFGDDGGIIHALNYTIESQPDLTIFTLYNACNNYEFLLVQ